jgi:hypothetical protein
MTYANSQVVFANLPPSFSSPPAVARVTWSRLGKRLETLDRLWMEQAALEAEVARLRDSIGDMQLPPSPPPKPVSTPRFPSRRS